MKAISPTLANVLRANRAELNTRFASARHLYPRLNSLVFGALLQTAVDELVQSVERVRPDRIGDVALAAYDAALELAGQDLIGPAARHPFVEESWRILLPKVAAIVASDPSRVIASVSNAVHQLATIPETRPQQWIEVMASLAPDCSDVETFLKLGQVAGWRAGLAHFRRSALAMADTLPERLALAAIGAKPDTRWAEARGKLLQNPWHNPAEGHNDITGIRLAAQAGAFRGFGGLFSEPPEVASAGEHFLVYSGGDCWLLTADAFGATFHRATKAEFEDAQSNRSLPTRVKIKGSHILLDEQPFEFPALGDYGSVAANDTTLALTGRFTHTIVLVALQ